MIDVTNSKDLTLKCRDCQGDFVFTEGEQKFYAEKQLTSPSRCKPCRAANKARRAGADVNVPGRGYAPPPVDFSPPPQTFDTNRAAKGKDRSKAKPDWDVEVIRKRHTSPKRRHERWEDDSDS